MAILPTLVYHIDLKSDQRKIDAALPADETTEEEGGIGLVEAELQLIQAINMSLVQVFMSVFLLVISGLFQIAKKPILATTLPPIMNQTALVGMLPLSAMKLPNYPLLHANLPLLAVATTTNIIYLVRSAGQFALVFIILLLSIALSSINGS